MGGFSGDDTAQGRLRGCFEVPEHSEHRVVYVCSSLPQKCRRPVFLRFCQAQGEVLHSELRMVPTPRCSVEVGLVEEFRQKLEAAVEHLPKKVSA